jgi:hypothetical protein
MNRNNIKFEKCFTASSLSHLKSGKLIYTNSNGSHRGRDYMVVELSCEFESCSWRGVLDTTLCDKVCQ